MNPSKTFILRPVATTLLTIAIVIAGAIAYKVLPVAPLPEVEFPTISVGAALPGASAEIMASQSPRRSSGSSDASRASPR